MRVRVEMSYGQNAEFMPSFSSKCDLLGHKDRCFLYKGFAVYATMIGCETRIIHYKCPRILHASLFSEIRF